MPITDPCAQESPRSRASHVSGFRRLCDFTFGLATCYGLLWAATWGLLRWWWHPTPDGAATLAASLAQRSDDPSIRSILNALQHGDIYTFDQLQAAASTLQQADTTTETELIVTMLGLLAIAGALAALLYYGLRWALSGPPASATGSPIGVIAQDDRFVSLPPPAPQLAVISLRQLQRCQWYPRISPLTPLATALLQRYAAAPHWPAASEGRHGETTLLDHALAVRSEALRLAPLQSCSERLAELAALGHDLGKLVTFEPDGQAGWRKTSPHHASMSALLIATLPEWSQLSQDEQQDLTIAIAMHHRPDSLPITASHQARMLLTLLRQADGLSSAREAGAQPLESPTSPAVAPTHDIADAPADTLPSRLTQALVQLLPTLRINTRPFDGRADPDAGYLMLLDLPFRRSLAAQLRPADQQALHLESPEAIQTQPHPATPAIVSALTQLDWLVQAHDGAQSELWHVQIGRRQWTPCWLLRLDALPEPLRTRWGRSEWPLVVLGPAKLNGQPPGPSPGSAAGRVAPLALLTLGGAIAGVAWLTQLPPQQRSELVCKPASLLREWMNVPETPDDDWAGRLNDFFETISKDCPARLGRPVASATEELTKQGTKTTRQLSDQLHALTGRKIEAVIDGERVKIEALGEARLLGIKVSRERQRQAVSYLEETVLGKPVTIAIDKARDPERRPLILVTTLDGTLVNARMVEKGLATPWHTQGPWQSWGTR
jgi:hypothetical protein